MLKNDLPITKLDEDKLDRQKFVLHLRKIIKNYEKTDCLTLGIMGSWGSGKTSFINMVFDQSNENILTEERFKLMRFNPWNFSKQQDLYYQFFDQLNNIIISNENDERKINNIKKMMDGYWKKISNNAQISLSFSGISYSKVLGEKTLENLKEELNDALKSLEYKLIIIIDDIDRLTDDEIQQIFILVKSLADFPNIIYILPFDKNIILKSIAKLQKNNTEEFLDKIVQLQIDLPKIPNSKIRNIFIKELEELFINEKIDMNFEHRNLRFAFLFLRSIRDVNRYINNLTFYLPLMNSEINTLDSILLMGIQLFENEIYHEIKNNKTFFTENLIKRPNDDELSEYKRYFKYLLDKKQSLTEEDLIKLLTVLFPQLTNFDGNWDMSNQISKWSSELKICSYKMFDKYFELTLDENEISNSYFEMIIKSEDYDFIKKEVLNFDAEGKSEGFIDKLTINASKVDSKNIKLFLRLLFDIGDSLNIKTNDIIFSKDYLLSHCVFVLSKVLNNEELYDAMGYAIKNADDCLNLLVHILSSYDKNNHRFRFKNQNSGSEKVLTNEQLDELENEACIKIKQCVEKGKLFEVYRALEVIYNWYFWDNEEYCKFIEKVLENDEGVMGLIKISITTDYEENDMIIYKFDFPIMEEIYPLDVIYNRIKRIVLKIDDNDERRIYECFINEYIQKYGNNN